MGHCFDCNGDAANKATREYRVSAAERPAGSMEHLGQGPKQQWQQQEEQEEEEGAHLLRVVFRGVESDQEGDLEARVKGGFYRRP